jgi:hypothetical protein
VNDRTAAVLPPRIRNNDLETIGFREVLMVTQSLKFLSSTAIVVAGLITLPIGARSDELAAYSGQTVTLEGFRGTVYYAPNGAEFVVVVTMDNAGQPVRFVTSLTPGQKAKVSTPGAPGEAETAVELRRDGDQFFVNELPRTNRMKPLQSKALLSD